MKLIIAYMCTIVAFMGALSDSVNRGRHCKYVMLSDRSLSIVFLFTSNFMQNTTFHRKFSSFWTITNAATRDLRWWTFPWNFPYITFKKILKNRILIFLVTTSKNLQDWHQDQNLGGAGGGLVGSIRDFNGAPISADSFWICLLAQLNLFGFMCSPSTHYTVYSGLEPIQAVKISELSDLTFKISEFSDQNSNYSLDKAKLLFDK